MFNIWDFRTIKRTLKIFDLFHYINDYFWIRFKFMSQCNSFYGMLVMENKIQWSIPLRSEKSIKNEKLCQNVYENVTRNKVSNYMIVLKYLFLIKTTLIIENHYVNWKIIDELLSKCII